MSSQLLWKFYDLFKQFVNQFLIILTNFYKRSYQFKPCFLTKPRFDQHMTIELFVNQGLANGKKKFSLFWQIKIGTIRDLLGRGGQAIAVKTTKIYTLHIPKS